jgi:hypothetical protein
MEVLILENGFARRAVGGASAEAGFRLPGCEASSAIKPLHLLLLEQNHQAQVKESNNRTAPFLTGAFGQRDTTRKAAP